MFPRVVSYKPFLLDNQGKWLNSLQALRAIAFIGIVTYHCGITPCGPWGVSVFFVLSGFVCYYRFRESESDVSLFSSFKFALQRIAKLYPLHITMIILVIIRESYERGTVSASLFRLVADGLLVTSWIPDTFGFAPYNGVAWFLSTIFFSYFAFRYVVGIVNRIEKTRDAIFCSASILLLQLCLTLLVASLPKSSEQLIIWFTYQFPLFRFGDFLIGCFVGRLYTLQEDDSVAEPNHNSVAEGLLATLIFFQLILYSLKLGILGSETIRYTLLFVPTSALTVYLFAKRGGVFTKLLTNSLLVNIAKWSGSGFLIHQYVIYCVKTIIDGGGAWVSFSERVIVFGISLAITYFLSLLYDKTYSALANPSSH